MIKIEIMRFNPSSAFITNLRYLFSKKDGIIDNNRIVIGFQAKKLDEKKKPT